MSELALQLIAENKKSKSTSLDLGNCGLKEIPKDVYNLTWLQELILSNNTLDYKRRSVAINNTRYSYYSEYQIRNVITYIDEDVYRLTNLKRLDMGGGYDCRWNVKNLGFLGSLTQLEDVNLRFTGIQDCDILSGLHNLKNLNLEGNQIRNAGMLAELTTLRHLNISSNNLYDIGFAATMKNLGSLNVCRNIITDISALQKLENLLSLNISNNKITSLSDLQNLTTLQELHAGFNAVKNVDVLHRLAHLNKLSLKQNCIELFRRSDYPGRLHWLDIRNNNIEQISSDIVSNFYLELDIKEAYLLKKGCFHISGNPVKDIPKDIIEQGNSFVIEYIKSSNKIPLNECKVVITGRGGAGKTSLQKRLFGNELFNPNESQTHGIRKRCWNEIRNPIDNTNINVHFWDMGGQQEQQTLHHLFYTENTVYILVLDGRLGEDPEDFLEMISGYGDNCPTIIVINNKIDLANPGKVAYNLDPEFTSSILSKYHNIRKVIGVCCGQDNDEGVATLRKYLHKLIPQLEHVREEYPSEWLQIKEELLKKIDCNYVRFDEYVKLCDSKGVKKEQLQVGLAKMLHTTGTVTYFDNPTLNFYILNPDWVTNGAYQIMLSPVTAQKKGKITYADLKKIFEGHSVFEYSKEDLGFLMQLMMVYNLCHLFDSKNEWLIPAGLTGKPRTDLEVYKKDDYRLYCLKYSVAMPESIIQRFISRNIEHSFDNDYWKNGILLQYESNETLLYTEANFKEKTICIWIKGKEILEAWKFFRKDFIDISKKFEYDELVAVKKNDNAMISYKVLLNLYRNLPKEQLKNWYSPELNLYINVIETLGLIEDKTLKSISNEISDTTKEVFFSYAWGKQDDLVDNLYNALSVEKGYKLYRDKKTLEYKSLISDFMKRLGKANFIILILNDKYLRSEYCMYELYEIYRNSKLELDELRKKVYPIYTDNLQLHKPSIQKKYVLNWQNYLRDWEELKQVSDSFTDFQNKRYNVAKKIVMELGDLLEFLSDINALTAEKLSADNFDMVIKAIKEIG